MSCQMLPGVFLGFAYHAAVMNPGVIVTALRQERAELAVRWLEQFAVSRASVGHPTVDLDEVLILELFDDLVALINPAPLPQMAGPADHADALGRLAEFPDSIAVTLDLLQAGLQVLGAFAVENAGPWATWSGRERNRFLGELDAVFPVLVDREVAALCERYLPDSVPPVAVSRGEMLGLPDWARTIARRH